MFGSSQGFLISKKIKALNLLIYLLETYSYSHDINNIVAAVNIVSGAESIVNNTSPSELRFLLSSSIANLRRNGTVTFIILAEANKPSANVTRLRIIISS